MVKPMPLRSGIYLVQIDRWYIERTVWLIAGLVLLVATALATLVEPRWVPAVGVNISVASLLVLVHSVWWLPFTGFVGAAMVWFAATGFCIMANSLYWLGAEPRLVPEQNPMPAAAAVSGPPAQV